MQNVTILKEFEEFGQQSKNWYCENKRLEQIVILKDPNDVCECIISWYYLCINKEKIEQVCLSGSKWVSKKGYWKVSIRWCQS